MEVILVILVGVIIAVVLADRASGPPESGKPPSSPTSRSGSRPGGSEVHPLPSRPLRADAAEVLPLVFDAQEQVVLKSRRLSNALLAKLETGTEELGFVSETLQELEEHLQAIGTNREALQSTLDRMPEDQILLIPDFDSFMGSMLDQWLSAMYRQGAVVSLALDRDDTLTPDEREAEKARQALDAIGAAIELLDQVKMAGAVSAENTRECIAAFVVDLVSADGEICARELAFLNRVFSRDWDAATYRARYAAKLGDDRAATELVLLLEEVGQYNRNMSIFLNRALQPLVSNAITADGEIDEAETEKLSAFNGLLQQRLGATGDLRQAVETA